MTTKQVRVFFTADGPVADFLTDDGTRERSVVRRPADIAAAQFRPVNVTSYGQLLALLASAGVTFAGEDVAAEQAIEAAEVARVEKAKAERKGGPKS